MNLAMDFYRKYLRSIIFTYIECILIFHQHNIVLNRCIWFSSAYCYDCMEAYLLAACIKWPTWMQSLFSSQNLIREFVERACLYWFADLSITRLLTSPFPWKGGGANLPPVSRRLAPHRRWSFWYGCGAAVSTRGGTWQRPAPRTCTIHRRCRWAAFLTVRRPPWCHKRYWNGLADD